MWPGYNLVVKQMLRITAIQFPDIPTNPSILFSGPESSVVCLLSCVLIVLSFSQFSCFDNIHFREYVSNVREICYEFARNLF